MSILKKLSMVTAGAVVIAFGTVSNAQALTLIGLDNNNNLFSFDSATPGTASSVPVTGLMAGDTLQGIDFRPANGLLYGITNNSNIYTIAPITGAATLVSNFSSTVLSGTSFGVDFNPVVDRLRVVSDLDQNLRINVDTGTTNVDGNLNPGN